MKLWNLTSVHKLMIANTYAANVKLPSVFSKQDCHCHGHVGHLKFQIPQALFMKL